MYEDKPEKDTPQNVIDDLREYGGVSPFGDAIWRMVLAQNCRIHCFGRLNHMPEGLDIENLPVDEQEGNQVEMLTGEARVDKVAVHEAKIRETRTIQPVRTEEGEFWVPRYQFDGWILQRWFPAIVWGTREKWEGERAQDGRTRMLAAYPSRGDYMMMPCGPWKTITEAGDLKGAIRCYNAQQRRNPVNWGNHMLAMAAFEEQERQQKADAYAEELSAQYRIAMSGILRSASSSAQEFRNLVSEHTAGGVNLGASEKW